MSIGSVPAVSTALWKSFSKKHGVFEAEQIASLLAHLPADIQPVIEFAYITGWRIKSEVLPLEWRHLDFAGNEVRLDPHTTKNDDGRVFVMTKRLQELLKAQHVEHDKLKKAGMIAPVGVLAHDRRRTRRPEEATTDPRVQESLGRRMPRGRLPWSHPTRLAANGGA